jgi:glycosyltransferase involved in cell wall biosynthesis
LDSLVSIITPFFNTDAYLAQAIQSVLDQTYHNWELLLVNDGSTDASKEIALSFKDSRINYFELKNNKGVSEARNVALSMMKGDYFCFLDSDDELTPQSLLSRAEILEANQGVHFADGSIEKRNYDMSILIDVWKPNFDGNPLKDLVSLTGDSFFGLSWMFRTESFNARFLEGLAHGEDLLFCMELSRNPNMVYAHTNTTVLKYRIHPHSAMNQNLKKLENGYNEIYETIREWPELSPDLTHGFRDKTKRIMFKSYMRRGQLLSALKML